MKTSHHLANRPWLNLTSSVSSVCRTFSTCSLFYYYVCVQFYLFTYTHFHTHTHTHSHPVWDGCSAASAGADNRHCDWPHVLCVPDQVRLDLLEFNVSVQKKKEKVLFCVTIFFFFFALPFCLFFVFSTLFSSHILELCALILLRLLFANFRLIVVCWTMVFVGLLQVSFEHARWYFLFFLFIKFNLFFSTTTTGVLPLWKRHGTSLLNLRCHSLQVQCFIIFWKVFNFTCFKILIHIAHPPFFQTCSMFIVVDTQLLMSKLSADEYILCAVNLYLDIVNLFLYILRILNSRK